MSSTRNWFISIPDIILSENIKIKIYHIIILLGMRRAFVALHTVQSWGFINWH